MSMAENEIPRVNLRFLFVMCNDILTMRHFYTDLLGMKETSFTNDEHWGWLNYKSEGLEFMFFRAKEKMPVQHYWTWQPGYDGGTVNAISWAIHIPEADFESTVDRLKRSGIKSFSKKPEWRQDNYWGFSVMDPMGNTVEVYTIPKARPELPEWPDK